MSWLRKSYLITISFILLTATASSAQQSEYLLYENVVLKERLILSFTLSLDSNLRQISTKVLCIDKGKNEFLTLLLDYDKGNESSLFLLGSDIIHRVTLSGSAMEMKEERVAININSLNDNFKITISDTSYLFRGLGFESGDKYSITLLPFSNSNYDQFDNESIVIDSVELTGNILDNVSYTEILLLLLLVVADIILFVIIHFRNRYLKKKKGRVKSNQVSMKNVELARPEISRTSSILLFGGFRIFTMHGEEISKSFSPTLKELFLLLVCRSGGTGISSARLREILWFDKDEQSARNNRSVYITKLRQILDTLGEHEISSSSGSWIIDLKDISVDFLMFNAITGRETISEDDIVELISIIRQGSLLPECDYSWLDEIKAKTSDNAITILTNYAEHIDIKQRPDLLSSIADALFVVDPVSDLALSYKCKYYNHVGKGFLAKQLYATFLKDYKNFFNEEYTKTYSDIIIEETQ